MNHSYIPAIHNTVHAKAQRAGFLRILAVLSCTVLFLILQSCGDEEYEGNSLEEARLLRQSGNYVQSVMLFEEVVARGDSQPELLLEYAQTAVLAAQTERNTLYRQKAREAITLLSLNQGDLDTREIGELWRRLGWEMARDSDSLQAFQCFELALEFDIQGIFEAEWLFRGVYAGNHLELLSNVPDSVIGTAQWDSLLAITAEVYLVELERIPRARTDLRSEILTAKADLLPYTNRKQEELDVLTELDRLGRIQPDARLRRIHLLIDLAEVDMDSERATMAREKLLEVWNSNFSGERIQAAFLLGLMSEENSDIDGALQWYRRACGVSPGSSSQAAVLAAARRDSLTYEYLDEQEF